MGSRALGLTSARARRCRLASRDGVEAGTGLLYYISKWTHAIGVM